MKSGSEHLTGTAQINTCNDAQYLQIRLASSMSHAGNRHGYLHVRFSPKRSQLAFSAANFGYPMDGLISDRNHILDSSGWFIDITLW